jgi:hypothetical protein
MFQIIQLRDNIFIYFTDSRRDVFADLDIFLKQVSVFIYVILCYIHFLIKFEGNWGHVCPSQWPHFLRREPSSPAGTLRSWFEPHLKHGCP